MTLKVHSHVAAAATVFFATIGRECSYCAVMFIIELHFFAIAAAAQNGL